MGHGKIRENKNCLNCGHIVEERFCPNCGQENIETRQPFYYLFAHFIEDFTHYDGQFWKTIKYLLFKPGRLTKEYLIGKRQAFVAPVKLYIFISFITFFLPTLLPSSKNAAKNDKKTAAEIKKEKAEEERIAKFTDSLTYALTKERLKKDSIRKDKNLKITEVNNNDIETDVFEDSSDGKLKILGAANMKQYDSLYVKDAENKNVYTFMKPFAEKVFHLQEQGLKKEQIFERFAYTLVHTLPKALFIYLPIFAFFLWVFHNKKRWWYFDHSIFTLHYFSFLLLGILILIMFSRLLNIFPDYGIFTFLSIFIHIAAIIYMSVYFFIGHHRVYESSKSMSVFKGISLFIVNFFGLLFMFLLLVYVSFVTMH